MYLQYGSHRFIVRPDNIKNIKSLKANFVRERNKSCEVRLTGYYYGRHQSMLGLFSPTIIIRNMNSRLIITHTFSSLLQPPSDWGQANSASLKGGWVSDGRLWYFYFYPAQQTKFHAQTFWVSYMFIVLLFLLDSFDLFCMELRTVSSVRFIGVIFY